MNSPHTKQLDILALQIDGKKLKLKAPLSNETRAFEEIIQELQDVLPGKKERYIITSKENRFDSKFKMAFSQIGIQIIFHSTTQVLNYRFEFKTRKLYLNNMEKDNSFLADFANIIDRIVKVIEKNEVVIEKERKE